jgi:2-dehydro-3-deoxyphosphooctonate aldolase (KDO 8-P synthase)
MILICGPCVIEPGKDYLYQVAKQLVSLKGFDEIIFKSSCIKNNRTRTSNYYGVGFSSGIKQLLLIKQEFGLKITTDFHTAIQIENYGQYVDMIQIPAYLAMQTDLANAAAKSGKPIHIKKPQFLNPAKINLPINKIKAINPNAEIIVTDRGTSFGYDNVMIDPRHIRLMKMNGASTVVVDVTHPNKYWDDYTFAFDLALSAKAVGADGIFMEVHPDPKNALCDADSQVPLDEAILFLQKFVS